MHPCTEYMVSERGIDQREMDRDRPVDRIPLPHSPRLPPKALRQGLSIGRFGLPWWVLLVGSWGGMIVHLGFCPEACSVCIGHVSSDGAQFIHPSPAFDRCKARPSPSTDAPKRAWKRTGVVGSRCPGEGRLGVQFVCVRASFFVKHRAC